MTEPQRLQLHLLVELKCRSQLQKDLRGTPLLSPALR